MALVLLNTLLSLLTLTRSPNEFYTAQVASIFFVFAADELTSAFSWLPEHGQQRSNGSRPLGFTPAKHR